MSHVVHYLALLHFGSVVDMVTWHTVATGGDQKDTRLQQEGLVLGNYLRGEI